MDIENENIETIETPDVEISVVETGAAPVVVVETETAPVESGATISQLVETIASLNDSITALRLQVESERNSNTDLIFDRFNDLAAKIDKLLTVEIAEHQHETAEPGIAETVEEIGRKPVKRWI